MKHKLLDNIKRDIIIKLEKAGKKEKKGFLLGLAKALDVSSRNFASVNVYKLEKLSQKNKDKIFVVPGNVLGFGDLKSQINVYAYRFSDAALEKIKVAKGTAKNLYELINDKVEGKDVVIVK